MSVENKKIIALVSDDFEDLELWYPVLRLREAGAVVHLVSENKDTVYHGKYGVPVTSDYSFEEIIKEEYDGILVPGGWSPDKLRRFPKVIEFVQYFDQQKETYRTNLSRWLGIDLSWNS